MLCQLGYVAEDPLHKPGRGLGIFQCDEVCNCVKIAERGIGPDYFSHRARRFRASCVATRFSAIACSPRAMPSNTAMRRSIAS